MNMHLIGTSKTYLQICLGFWFTPNPSRYVLIHMIQIPDTFRIPFGLVPSFDLSEPARPFLIRIPSGGTGFPIGLYVEYREPSCFWAYFVRPSTPSSSLSLTTMASLPFDWLSSQIANALSTPTNLQPHPESWASDSQPLRNTRVALRWMFINDTPSTNLMPPKFLLSLVHVALRQTSYKDRMTRQLLVALRPLRIHTVTTTR